LDEAVVEPTWAGVVTDAGEPDRAINIGFVNSLACGRAVTAARGDSKAAGCPL
jgi:hypothetical protein